MRAASRTCSTTKTRRYGRRAAVIRGGVADMKSLDTNILLYAADEDCREHDLVLAVTL